MLTCIIDDSDRYAREKFGVQKGISSDEFFGRGNYDSNAQSEAKSRLQGFELPKAVMLDWELWSVDNGLTTPTFKAKRPQLKEKYSKEIAAMYASLN